jgi:hypothetical protein
MIGVEWGFTCPTGFPMEALKDLAEFWNTSKLYHELPIANGLQLRNYSIWQVIC